MFWRHLLLGVLAGSVVTSLRWAWVRFPEVNWMHPAYLLVAVLFFIAIKLFVYHRLPSERQYRGYTGLSDLLLRIHLPPTLEFAERWMLRAMGSGLLALFGGVVGPEGAAIETTQAAAVNSESHSARWFENERRKDTASALAAGIAAGFSAPFAAILLTVEMRIGGAFRPIADSAVAAFLTVQAAEYTGLIPPMDLQAYYQGVELTPPQLTVGVLAALLMGALGGVLSAVVIRFLSQAKESFHHVMGNRPWLLTLAGGVFLVLTVLAYPEAHQDPITQIEKLISSQYLPVEAGLLWGSRFLGVLVILSAFGSAGVVWPLFFLGSLWGLLILSVLTGGLPYFALAGGAAFLGGIFGSPLGGAVLVFELTGSVPLLFCAAIAGYLANKMRSLTKTQPYFESDLKVRGFELDQGRSLAVLDSLSVERTMVTDFETVYENESIDVLQKRLAKSAYPFFPVATRDGKYVGLLSADVVEVAWRAHESMHSEKASRLPDLVEAKDLVYSSGIKVKSVRTDSHLSDTTHLFRATPVVPVVDRDDRIQGLLFGYDVRTAYDREVAQRALK